MLHIKNIKYRKWIISHAKNATRPNMRIT